MSIRVPTGHTAHGTVSPLPSSYRWPSGQRMQSPLASENILAGQAHSVDPSGAPRPPVQPSHTHRPGDAAAVLAAHAVQGVAAVRSASTCPATHSSHIAEPSAAKVPTAHSVHFTAFSVCDAVPAGQVWHRPCSSFHVPAAHVDEQQAAYGSSPIGVVLLSPLSSSEPAGHKFPAVDQSAQLSSQHGADRGSYPAGQPRLEPH